MVIFSNKIYTPNGIIEGYIHLEDGKIQKITKSAEGLEFIDYSGKNIIPGFVDIHVHGFGRGSFGYNGSKNSIELMAKDIVHGGVTSFLATTSTTPIDFMENALTNIRDYIEDGNKGNGADIIGVHLEGPFINAEYIGMQDITCIQKPSIEAFDHYNVLTGGNVRLMTLAPELEGGLDVIRHLKSKGISTSAGHTAATFDQIKEAINAGLTNFTHTYSGMKGFHHRELGVVGAAMYFEDMYAEVAKQTGITIKHEAFDILYRLKKDRRMVMMTDCLGIAGYSEGASFYHYLRKTRFSIENGKLVITPDKGEKVVKSINSFADVKDLEMSFIESIKNVVDRLEDGLMSVTKIASENPAKIAGTFDRKGSIETGKDADLLILDKELNIVDVYCCGIKQDLNS